MKKLLIKELIGLISICMFICSFGCSVQKGTQLGQGENIKLEENSEKTILKTDNAVKRQVENNSILNNKQKTKDNANIIMENSLEASKENSIKEDSQKEAIKIETSVKEESIIDNVETFIEEDTFNEETEEFLIEEDSEDEISFIDVENENINYAAAPPPEEEEIVINNYSFNAEYSSSDFYNQGVIEWGGWSWTFYCESEDDVTATPIPGKYVDENGYICDENGYICLASSALDFGTIVDTPFGKMGKVYDCGCLSYILDVYVSW